ncbi:group II intron maturase-specific domain-containing protein [Paraburkholderia aromaticivorans]|uniref:group II intron maturase-specific domain-containing protein n=1 Tax=Paraburkholderia aromaticivorans TaxID=2026199 RepID=UPI001455EF94|nr:group II intron maturase-specific domain-containing protein [Paraburkholderia aromaticivorans]
MLDDLDREHERRGLHFVRYADDSNVYVRSERAGKRVTAGLKAFLTGRLKLKVNEAKSAVALPHTRKLLGFTFSNRDQATRRIAPKALARFKDRIRELTQRTRGISVDQMIGMLKGYLTGWRGYFGYCETPGVLRKLDEWIRRRMRCFFWKQWKHSPARFQGLTARGGSRNLVAQTVGSPHGGWRLRCSPALSIALSNHYFARLGFHRSVHSRSTDPNRRVRTRTHGVVWRGLAVRLAPIPILETRIGKLV